MRQLFFVLLCLRFFLTFVGAQNPIKDKIPPAIQDRFETLQPSQIRLTGYLGQRVTNNESNRLLHVDLEPLLAGYKNRPGSHPWIGEHIGKWLHAATLAWVYTGDKALKTKLDGAVTTLVQCQEADGYLGTYVPERRFGLFQGSDWDVWSHKYNLLGLLTYHRYTGSQPALGACQRMGDLLIATFGKGRKSILSAGTHVGMAATSVLEPMVLLYRATGERRYLVFARYIVEAWDEAEGPHVLSTLTKLGAVEKTANGKAYEMLSNLVGLCELARVTGERNYMLAAQKGWESVVRDHLYLTGTASHGEHFHAPHELPNQPSANIGETCVTVTWIQLTSQLLRLTGDVKYGEELERSYYNHLSAAQRPDGKEWCYYTALEGTKPYGPGINCCVSSGPRGMAMAPQMACFVEHGKGGDRLVINLFEPFQARVRIGGQEVLVTQETGFPMEGDLRIVFTMKSSVKFSVALRQPKWAEGMQLAGAQEEGGWLVLPFKTWRTGAQISATLPLRLEQIQGSFCNKGKTSLRYGVLVLAYDGAQNRSPISERFLSFSSAPEFKIERTKSVQEFAVLAGVQAGQKHFSARFVPFSEVGATGKSYRIWLREAGATLPQSTSLLAFGEESRSREGNQGGSILDDDPSSIVVTFDGQKHKEDWFAITLMQAVTLKRITYVHGRTFHDGGWFDSSQGKPRIQVQRTLNGAWEEVGVLSAYPETTATDAKGLKQGESFTLQLDADMKVFGVRVVGVPAHGDNPAQSFTSCAELQASP
jgi:DUF1680 family protein